MTQSDSKLHFKAVNLVLISIFSALWIVFNFTVASLAFRITGLPIIHAVISYLILLLATWTTKQYGVASVVGIIGSTIVLLAGGPLPVIGFAAGSIVFDAILLLNRHKLNLKPANLAVAVLATVASAYFAGVLNGIFILNQMPVFAATFWGGWTIAGALIGFAIAYPIIGVLDRANVKKVQA